MICETNFDQWALDSIDPVWPDARSYAQRVIDLGLAGHQSLASAYVEDYLPLRTANVLWAWGVFPYWEGVGEAWMIFDKHAAGHAPRILTEARRFLARAEAPPRNFHRIFGQFDTRVKANYKLAKLLGFEEEGLLRKHVGEHDYAVFARVH